MGMRALPAALALTVLVGTAACGEDRPAADAADDCVRHGTTLARADLDDDGTTDTVRLCAHRLVAEVGGKVLTADVRGLGPDPARARAVRLRDNADLVLLPSARGRGGAWRPHLFGVGPGGLAELEVGGRPVLPELSTAPGRAPMTASCTEDGGLSVVTARVHQPPGFVLAWDLTTTTYDVRAGVVTRGRTSTVESAGADPTLRNRMPHLFDGSVLADCS
jgi:hypothetical protein